MRMLDRLLPRSAATAPPTGDGHLAAAAPGVPGAAADAELARRRDTLARELAEAQWDLGGLTYEMAIRDHFRLDVLLRRAAVLQGLDAELAEIERLLRLDEQGAAGFCPACGAPHSRLAVYCWGCATELIPVQEGAS